MGRDYSENKWNQLLEQVKKDNYLIQEFIDIPQIEMPVFKNNKIYFEEFGYQLGVYMYDQEISGYYTRTGRKNIIGSRGESFIAVNYLVDSD